MPAGLLSQVAPPECWLIAVAASLSEPFDPYPSPLALLLL
jgi:hypothetical protein